MLLTLEGATGSMRIPEQAEEGQSPGSVYQEKPSTYLRQP